MDSQRKRSRSVWAPTILFQIFLRLLPVIFFGWMLIDFLSIQKPDSGNVGQYFDYHFKRSIVQNEKFVIRFVIFGMLSLISVLSIIIIVAEINSEYIKKGSVHVPSVEAFFNDGIASRKDFILVLRPFGFDGNLYVKRKKGVFKRFLNPVVGNLTIEQIVAQKAKALAGFETVSVTDPEVDLLAPGPTYVSCSQDGWLSEVTRLIRSAKAVIFVFPPNTVVTPSIKRELEVCRTTGMHGCVAVVVPPKKQKGALNTKKIIEEMSIFSDVEQDARGLNFELDRLLVLALGQTTYFWYELLWVWPFSILQQPNEETYGDFFVKWFGEASLFEQSDPFKLSH